MAVLNDIGHGLREKTYERGLYVEFEEQGLEYNSQHVYPVFYKGRKIDEYIPDLEVEVILNFKHAKLEWKKVVLTENK